MRKIGAKSVKAKIFAILLCGVLIGILFFCLASCEQTVSVHFDKLPLLDGVFMVPAWSSYEEDAEEIQMTWVNNTTKTLTFGNAYFLVKKSGDKWKKLTPDTDTVFTDVGYTLLPGSQTDHTYRLCDTYSNLKAGDYRIVANFFDGADKKYTYAEFALGTDEEEYVHTPIQATVGSPGEAILPVRLLLVGEEKEVYVNPQTDFHYEFRVTETSVQRDEQIIHREDIAAVNENKITMRKSGDYKLWKISGDTQEIFLIRGLDIGEMECEIRTGSEFETTLYFPKQAAQGEYFNFIVINKNITGKDLEINQRFLNQFKGSPGVKFFTVIDGCKLYVGNTINYAAIPGPYTYSPDETIRLVETYTAIVERRSVKRLNDGKQAEDNDPVLTALGFSPYLYDNRYWEHKRTREELWEELNARYRPGDPEYALEWNKIFYDYPLVNPFYHRIPAPKGMYHIELSTGEVIDNAFEII